MTLKVVVVTESEERICKVLCAATNSAASESTTMFIQIVFASLKEQKLSEQAAEQKQEEMLSKMSAEEREQHIKEQKN